METRKVVWKPREKLPLSCQANSTLTCKCWCHSEYCLEAFYHLEAGNPQVGFRTALFNRTFCKEEIFYIFTVQYSSHMWPLSTWNEELSVEFYLVLIHLNLNNGDLIGQYRLRGSDPNKGQKGLELTQFSQSFQNCRSTLKESQTIWKSIEERR